MSMLNLKSKPSTSPLITTTLAKSTLPRPLQKLESYSTSNACSSTPLLLTFCSCTRPILLSAPKHADNGFHSRKKKHSLHSLLQRKQKTWHQILQDNLKKKKKLICLTKTMLKEWFFRINALQYKYVLLFNT